MVLVLDSNDISGICCYIISFRVDFFYILFYIAVIDIDFNCKCSAGYRVGADQLLENVLFLFSFVQRQNDENDAHSNKNNDDDHSLSFISITCLSFWGVLEPDWFLGLFDSRLFKMESDALVWFCVFDLYLDVIFSEVKLG